MPTLRAAWWMRTAPGPSATTCCEPSGSSSASREDRNCCRKGSAVWKTAGWLNLSLNLSLNLFAPRWRSPYWSSLRRRSGMISAGRKRASISSLASGVISLMNELLTCENSSSAIRNTVSMSGSRWRLAIIMVNSAAISVSGRTPRIMTRAPHCRTNSTAKPVKIRTWTLPHIATTRRT
jgi:hypothetical protein